MSLGSITRCIKMTESSGLVYDAVCRVCRFYDEKDSRCHRYPPSRGESITGSFVRVALTDWCGEFEDAD